MKVFSIPLPLILCVAACGDEAPLSDEGGDSGGTTATDTGATSNLSAPTPGGDSGSGTDDGANTDSTGGDETTMGGDETTTGGETPVDQLPFGGFVSWTIQDLFAYGDADFYEIEYPDDPNYEPWSWELPLEPPRVDDEWIVIPLDDGPPPPGPKIPDPTITDLDIGPQFFVDGSDISFTMEFDPKNGVWEMPSTDLAEIYAGGAWSIDFPGNDRFPAEVLEDALPGVAGDAAAFEFITDGDGIPLQMVWNPLDAQSAFAFMLALGPAGEFFPLCVGSLADDGSADIPADCVGEGAVEIPPGFILFVTLAGQNFQADVAYAERRIRLGLSVNTQIDTPFPFTP